MHHLFSKGNKKSCSQTSLPCKTRMCFCDWSRSSREQFGPSHLFQFHTPYIRVLKPRRTWKHDSVRRDTVKTKAWRPMQWRASRERFPPQGQTVSRGLLLTHMEHETDAGERYWKASAAARGQSAPDPLQESQGLPACHWQFSARTRGI